jgi:branched-chain amino acid transport system substrate-binding protein
MLPILLAVLGVTSACSSVGSGGSGGSSVGSGGSSGSGSITVGFINDTGGSDAVPDMSAGFAAAISYINGKMNGISGHKLKVDTCATDETPQVSVTCAEQLISAKPVVIFSAQQIGMDAAAPLYQSAGIPVISAWPIATSEFTSPNIYSIHGGIAGQYAAVAANMLNLKLTKVAYILVDVASAVTIAKQTIDTPLSAHGVSVQPIIIPVDAADMSPYVEEAKSSGAQAVYVVGTGAQCTSAMRAKQALGVTASFYYSSSCASQGVVAGAGAAAADGSMFPVELDYLNASNKDVQTFNQAWKQYGNGTASYQTMIGFSLGMTGATVLAGAGGAKATSNSIASYLKGTTNIANFMAHPMSCGTKQLPQFPSVCDSYFNLIVVKDGSLTAGSAGWISGSGLF